MKEKGDKKEVLAVFGEVCDFEKISELMKTDKFLESPGPGGVCERSSKMVWHQSCRISRTGGGGGVATRIRRGYVSRCG